MNRVQWLLVGVFLGGCPTAGEIEPTLPEIGVLASGLGEGHTATIAATVDGNDSTVEITANAVSFVVASELAEGVAFSLSVASSPDGLLCELATNASGTIETSSVYADLVCASTTETCNGLDDDGDGLADEDSDTDGDGVTTCGADGLPGTADDDCDDGNAAIAPGEAEVCGSGVDEDCSAETQDYVDDDGDGSPCGEDCDDADAGVHPAAAEGCNGLDDDCDLDVSVGETTDTDADGIPGDCDGAPASACGLFTAYDVLESRVAMPGVPCALLATGEAVPAPLRDAGGVMFTGLYIEWQLGVFEFAGVGLVSDGQMFALRGCADTTEGGVCEALGRPLLPVDAFVDELTYLDCAEATTFGCSLPLPPL